jgi:DNA-binding transcriptional ArsR family regulator
MIPREAANLWQVTQEALRMKLKRIKDSELVDELIREGKLKYYKPEEKQRKEWIITAEVIKILFPKNNRMD